MIKYQTHFDQIKEIDVIRETDKVVFLRDPFFSTKERREKKVGDYWSWHDSWESAHAYLIADAERKVETARLRLSQANGRLGQIKGMKKPAGGE